MTTVRLPSVGAPALRAEAREVIATVPRRVADAMGAPVAVFAPRGAEPMMVDLRQRRSAFVASAPFTDQLTSASRQAVDGVLARAVVPVQDDAGHRWGTLAIFDEADADSGADLDRLRELSAQVAAELAPYGPRGAGPAGATQLPVRQTPPAARMPEVTPTRTLPAPKDPTVPLHSLLGQPAGPTTLADADLRRHSLALADEVAGAGDAVNALLEQVDLRHDQVLHRHAAAVQERLAGVDRVRTRLRGHLEGASTRPRTRSMFELARVIDQAVTTVYQTLPGSQVDVDLIDDSLTVSADPGVVQRAITLLLSHAVEAATGRTVHLRAGVRGEDSGNIDGRLSVQLTVSFEGSQLSPAQLAVLAGQFADASRTTARRDPLARPAQLRVTATEHLAVGDGFEARSAREHSTFAAQWPLDLG